jgi:phage terminase large subunit-like protein
VAEAPLLGRTEPRLYTPPKRDLEAPGASYGHDVIRFSEQVLKQPLDPWQEWAVIHGGELDPDGRPRLRQILVLVARQNGKTTLLAHLALFWLFVEKQPRVHGLSADLSRARESWRLAVKLAQHTPALARQIAGVRLANSQETLETTSGCRYTIGAASPAAARGLTVNRLIIDELREHKTWEAYNAAMPAMAAVPDAQAWLVTTQGDDRSVVLHALREQALKGAIANGAKAKAS